MNIKDPISYPPAYGLHGMDSDNVEAALKRLNIDPDNCTVAEAVLALTSLQAFPPAPKKRRGAPVGNRNGAVGEPRRNPITIRLTDAEYQQVLAAAEAARLSVRDWVRKATISGVGKS